MSILDSLPSDPACVTVAKELLTDAHTIYNQMLDMYNSSTQRFWNNRYYQECSPSGISEALGNNAKELFILHYQLGQFLNSIKPGCVDATNTMIGNFTLNDDGTVTILPKIDNNN